MITEAATTGGIFRAKLAIVEALALTVVLLLLVMVMVPPGVVVVVVLVLFLVFVAIALVGAALLILAATLAGEPAPFDKDVVFGGEAQIGPCQRQQGRCRAGQISQRRATVLKAAEQARPIVKPAFVHALPLASPLLTTSQRFNRTRWTCTSVPSQQR